MNEWEVPDDTKPNIPWQLWTNGKNDKKASVSAATVAMLFVLLKRI